MGFLQKLRQINNNKKLQEIEYQKCKRDPWYWLQNWVFTLDVHDKQYPIKQFPCHNYLEVLTVIWAGPEIYSDFIEKVSKYYPRIIARELYNNWKPLLAVPKSRQMKVTWLFTSLYLWDTQFHRGKLNFFQSKKEKDANELIKRSKFIYDHQPSFLKKFRVNPSNKGKDIYCKLEFPELDSRIVGIPQGGDQIRSYTASGIFSDEMAFQTEAEDAFTAAKPTIDGGGKFTAVSSANPGYFHLLVEDQIGQYEK